ncbi:MAG: cell division/cell wall cluster transcriptional repressor MraZ [Dehalococcoidia bacterium]|nr:cell division/cell wall cluster transcriptional repressor MraZ [Dehalococcoidia bacterium]
MFFFGTFEHAIDERGRVAIPARYRRAFVDGGVLRVGPEGAVEMYTNGTFEAEVQRRLGAEDGNRSPEARRTRRAFLPEAYAVDLDKQGRILVPPQIRDRSNLGGKVLIIGCGDYLELWHPDDWAGEQAALERAAAEDGA